MEGLTRLVAAYGAAAVLLASFVENIGFPIPAFAFLLLAGAYAAIGAVSLPLLIAGAVAGAVGADLIWYAVGKRRGKGVLSFLCRMSLNPDVCVESAVDNFHRRKVATILFAKFLPGVNTVMPPLAGIASVPLHHFLLADTAGAALWSTVGAGLGFAYGERIVASASGVHGRMGWIFLLGLAGFLAWRLVYRYFLVRHYKAPRIGAQELSRAMSEDPPPLVIDLRRDDDYERSDRMVAGSVRLRPATFHRFAHHLPADRALVFYCT